MKTSYRINKITTFVLSIVLLFAWQLPLAAQEVAPQDNPGDLDTTFGASGKVVESFMVGAEVAMQKDNKIIVSGSDQVARFNPNGSLDTSFGNNGKTASLISSVLDIAVQSNGKILVAGWLTKSAKPDFAVARYNADGTADITFGSNGVVSTDFFGLEDKANAVAVQDDGSIVVGGHAGITQSTTDFALVRYTATGALDPTFGIGGLVNTDMSGDFEDIRDLVIQDGKIVAAGAVNSRTVVARYKTSGTLDNTFGVGGIIKPPINGSNAPQSVLVQNDGKIVCGGGSLGPNGTFDFMMVRLLNTGALDGSFGNGGIVFTDYKASSDTAMSLALGKDGRLLLAGEANVSAVNDFANRDFALACYKTDGTLDSTFGTGGKVTTDFFNNYDSVEGLVIQSNGRAVAVGRATNGEQKLGMAGYLFSEAANNGVPVIESVKVKGKRLIVSGVNFEAPSMIYLNGEKQKKTENDAASPTTMVIGLKAGNLIAPGATVSLQVKNLNTGKISDEYIFTRPLE
jgi:uncharacterized delta-60 repeat protein